MTRFLSPDEIKQLIVLAKDHSTREIVRILGRNKSTIIRNCKKLGIKTVTPPALPNSGSFKAPPENSKQFRFKKGRISDKRLPEGHVTILKRGFVRVKSGDKWIPASQVNPEINEAATLLRKLNRTINERHKENTRGAL